MGLPRKLLIPGERQVISVRTHWRSLIAPVVLLLAVVAFTSFCAALVPAGQYRQPARLGIAVLGALLVLRLTVWPFIEWATTTYTLTDRRLVNRTGVLRRTGRDIPLDRISDVAYERSLSDRLFGCGTLVVYTAGDAGETLIDDVPHVGEFHLAMTSLLLGDDRSLDRRVGYSGQRDQSPPLPRDNHYRGGRPDASQWEDDGSSEATRVLGPRDPADDGRPRRTADGGRARRPGR